MEVGANASKIDPNESLLYLRFYGLSNNFDGLSHN
jgi:hypothetical protein